MDEKRLKLSQDRHCGRIGRTMRLLSRSLGTFTSLPSQPFLSWVSGKPYLKSVLVCPVYLNSTICDRREYNNFNKLTPVYLNDLHTLDSFIHLFIYPQRGGERGWSDYPYGASNAFPKRRLYQKTTRPTICWLKFRGDDDAPELCHNQRETTISGWLLRI